MDDVSIRSWTVALSLEAVRFANAMLEETIANIINESYQVRVVTLNFFSAPMSWIVSRKMAFAVHFWNIYSGETKQKRRSISWAKGLAKRKEKIQAEDAR